MYTMSNELIFSRVQVFYYKTNYFVLLYRRVTDTQA